MIERRVARAKGEIEQYRDGEYVIVNDDFDRSYADLAHIYHAERIRRDRNPWIEPLVGRLERVGDRMVAGIVAAAFIRGIGELASADKERWGRWEGPLMGVGLGMAGALGTYLGWTARRMKRRPRR